MSCFVDLSGTWKLDHSHSESLDPLLRFQRVPWGLRQAVNLLAPTVVVEHEVDMFVWRSRNTFANTNEIYRLDRLPHEVATERGEVTFVAWTESDGRVVTCKEERDGHETRVERYLLADGRLCMLFRLLKINLNTQSVPVVTCKRLFLRQSHVPPRVTLPASPLSLPASPALSPSSPPSVLSLSTAANLSGTWRVDLQHSDPLEPFLVFKQQPWYVRKAAATISSVITVDHTSAELWWRIRTSIKNHDEHYILDGRPHSMSTMQGTMDVTAWTSKDGGVIIEQSEQKGWVRQTRRLLPSDQLLLVIDVHSNEGEAACMDETRPQPPILSVTRLFNREGGSDPDPSGRAAPEAAKLPQVVAAAKPRKRSTRWKVSRKGNEVCAQLSKPVSWKDDTHSRACCQCGLAFRLLRRRHHCRLCGNLFCSDCSRRRLLINSGVGLAATRVCDDCWTECHKTLAHNEQTDHLRRTHNPANPRKLVARQEQQMLSSSQPPEQSLRMVQVLLSPQFLGGLVMMFVAVVLGYNTH